MESINSTTFLTLPTILQLQIIKLTSWKDHKNLRLVCGHTLALVNYLGASSTFLRISNGNPFSFQRLKTCPFSSIRGLSVGFLTASLPIKSSTRLLIPKANRLEVGSNISTENILKLIRYYMKWCKILHFYHTNLPFIKNIAQFGPSQTCLVNVKTFIIQFSEVRYVRRYTSDEFQQRLKSFGQFLLWCSMPSLQELDLNFQQEEENSSPLTNGNKFFENLQKFLIKHGPRLNSLSLLLSTSFWLTIMPTFECMVNLEKIKIYYGAGTSLNSIDQVEVCKGFKHFAKLKSIRMDSGNEHNFKLAALLLSNNQNTIQSLDLENILSSLSWLYKIQASFCNLACLVLKIQYDEDSTIFIENIQQLQSLYKLTINIKSHTHATGREQQQHGDSLLDWRESFIDWLIGFSPNLQALHLTYFDKTPPRISDVELMIHGLTRLRTISFRSYGILYDHMDRQFLGIKFHPYIFSTDLENWFKSNPQIQFELPHLYKCVVNINRPYLIGQQPEEEEEAAP